jgi:hypothetical protein
MKFANATYIYRKSGGAQPRDLRFSGSFLGMFFNRAWPNGRTCGSSQGKIKSLEQFSGFTVRVGTLLRRSATVTVSGSF